MDIEEKYKKVWGLKDLPFEMGPDPRFLHLTPQHVDAFNTCMMTIKERRGFTAIYGDIGMGKSTIARLLMQKAGPGRFKAVYILNPSQYSEMQMLGEIIEELIKQEPTKKAQDALREELGMKRSKLESIKGLEKYMINLHAKGETLVLIIDEAQELMAKHFKLLLSLSNFESNQHKFLQMILIGQNELTKRLAKQRNIQSRSARYSRLQRLTSEDCRDMISFRWAIASAGKTSDPFTNEAHEAIHVVTRGEPREIIKLCHESLLLGLGEALEAEKHPPAPNSVPWKREVTADMVMTSAKKTILDKNMEE